MLIDTHCHLNILARNYQTKTTHLPFTTDEKKIISDHLAQAQKNNVTTIINVGTDLVESQASIEIAQLFANCYATIGLHPTDIDDNNWQSILTTFQEMLAHDEHKIVAIGECGIDLFHKKETLALQEKAFHAHIELALRNNLPLVVHSRNAADETLAVLQKYKHEENLRGTMHCFSYDLAIANDTINMNFVLGIDGPITYPKNTSLREVVEKTALEHIILETDAPFLPVQKMRGQINTPSAIADIAQFIADLKMVDLAIVAQTTSATAQKLFNLPK